MSNNGIKAGHGIAVVFRTALESTLAIATTSLQVSKKKSIVEIMPVSVSHFGPRNLVLIEDHRC